MRKARRRRAAAVLACPVRARERSACDAIKATLALDSDANLVRTAMYQYALFVLGAAAVDADLFRLELPRRPRARGRAAGPVGA
jgi:hypothetical protein